MNAVLLLAPSVQAARPLLDALAEGGLAADVRTPDTLSLDFAERRRAGAVVSLLGGGLPAADRLAAAEALAWLADIGVPVVNGLDAFVVGSSPARQVALFAHLGLLQPPSRVLGSAALLPGALDELGLGQADAEILEGPPLVVRGAVAERIRLRYVAGRLVGTNGGVPDAVVAAGAEVLGTAAIEFGSVTVAWHGEELWWLAADTSLDADEAMVSALAAHVRFRVGLPG